MKKNVSVVIVINEKNKILILKRGKDSPGAGLWNFPGGSIEEGETSAEAGVRELFEETNLETKIQDLTYLGKSNSKKIQVHFYITSKFSNNVKINKESEDFKWISLGEIDKYNFVGDNKTHTELIFQIGKFLYGVRND